MVGSGCWSTWPTIPLVFKAFKTKGKIIMDLPIIKDVACATLAFCYFYFPAI